MGNHLPQAGRNETLRGSPVGEAGVQACHFRSWSPETTGRLGGVGGTGEPSQPISSQTFLQLPELDPGGRGRIKAAMGILRGLVRLNGSLLLGPQSPK